MKSVAITGVSGYIGSRLARRLQGVDAVERIVGIDVRPPEDLPKLRFYRRDISQQLSDILVENEVDSAVHLVFVVKPTHNRTAARRVDIDGMASFLEACREAQVKHVLYLCSHTVYGAHPDNTAFLKEDSPPRPLRGFQYSWDKAEAERMARDYAASHEDVCVTILRSCPVIGPNAADSVVAAMFQPVIIAVAGYDPLLQFVHEDDLVEIMAILLAQGKAGVFNVAGDGEVRYSEVAKLSSKRMVAIPERVLRLVMGLSWRLRLQSESPPSGLEFIKYPPLVSTEKLKSETGFRFGYSSKGALVSFLSRSR